MRALILVAGATLALAACNSNNDAADNNLAVENLTAENLVIENDMNATTDMNAVDMNATTDMNAVDMNATTDTTTNM